MATVRDLLSNTGSRGQGIIKIRAFFIVTLLAATIVEIVGALGARSWSDSARFIVLNLILGGAAGLGGALLGFIFGIPRALSDDAGTAAPPPAGTVAPARRSRPNTNLEQISDWLTKILVGASLASLASIPDWLTKTVNCLDAGAYKGLPGGGTAAVFIAAYFLSLGFYWSYIETRTTLTELIDTYQERDPQFEDVLLRVRSAPWEPGTAPIPEDAEILALDPASLTTPALLEARAAAETRAGRYADAAQCYRQALAQDPGNPRLQTRLSMVLAAGGNTAAADRIVQRLQEATAANPAQRIQLDANRLFAALYKDPPQGFEEAIAIGERLLQSDQGASNGQLRFWLACAYAQRFRYHRRGQENEPIAPDDADRRAALAQLQEMVRLRPDLIADARSLFRPRSGAVDDDLAVFQGDSEFEQLLGGS